MKLLKVILAIIFAFLMLWILVAVFSPKTITIEESITIEQSQAEVFSHVNNLSHWTYWAIWYQKDKNMQISLSAKNSGEGARLTWVSDSEGDGKQEIVESHMPSYLRFKLNMSEWEENYFNWSFEKVDDFETRVTWTFEEVEIAFFLRPLGFSFSNSIKDDFTKSLYSLKEYCESLPQQNKKLAPSIIESSDIFYLSKSLKSEKDNMSADLGKAYGELISICSKNDWEIIGMPFTIYTSIGNTEIEYKAAFQLKEEVVAPDGYASGIINGGRTLTLSHFGLYENLGASYQMLDKYVNENDLNVRDSFYEVYITDPGMEPDSSKWETQIFYPLQN